MYIRGIICAYVCAPYAYIYICEVQTKHKITCCSGSELPYGHKQLRTGSSARVTCDQTLNHLYIKHQFLEFKRRLTTTGKLNFLLAFGKFSFSMEVLLNILCAMSFGSLLKSMDLQLDHQFNSVQSFIQL